jgi:hypothetical protein
VRGELRRLTRVARMYHEEDRRSVRSRCGRFNVLITDAARAHQPAEERP